LDQWAYCREHPYETTAFTAYEKAVETYWETLRSADPERYARHFPRCMEMEAAYPRGFAQASEQLRRGAVNALELPVRFLESDPWVQGSGYTKEWLIRHINRLNLPPDYVQRLQRVVLAVIDKADGRREFRSYCRLARKVDSAEFRQELERRLMGLPQKVSLMARDLLELNRIRPHQRGASQQRSDGPAVVTRPACNVAAGVFDETRPPHRRQQFPLLGMKWRHLCVGMDDLVVPASP
jgi:hypothetical protein